MQTISSLYRNILWPGDNDFRLALIFFDRSGNADIFIVINFKTIFKISHVAGENNNSQRIVWKVCAYTRERATKELPGAKVKLQEYQNHISKDYNTLRIAEEKLRFLKLKEHIIKLQTISG